jgi:hypothetical protein
MKKILTASTILFMGLTSTGFADSHTMIYDDTVEKDNTMMSTTSVEMSAKDKMKTKIMNRISNFSEIKIDIVLMRIASFRDTMDTSSLTDAKITSYNTVLDVLEEVLKEKKMMMDEEMMMDQLPNIVEGVVMKEEFSTLVVAVKAANLAETLA